MSFKNRFKQTYNSKSSTKFVTQWAAVNTYFLLITDPEHRYETSCEAKINREQINCYCNAKIDDKRFKLLVTSIAVSESCHPMIVIKKLNF